VLDVAEWLTVPLLVQQTVVPGATVGVEGVKSYSVIEMRVSPGIHGPGAACAPGTRPEAGTRPSKARNATTTPLRTLRFYEAGEEAVFEEGTSGCLPNVSP
jgi:hypothetical protein